MLFPDYTKEWNKHSEEIRNINTIDKLKSIFLSFISSTEHLDCAIYDMNSVQLLTRLRLKFQQFK